MREEIANMVVNNKLKKFIAKKREEEREMYLKTAKGQLEFFMSNMVPATIEDYEEWLKGFIQGSGDPTHYYDYPMDRVVDSFFIAIDDFEIIPLFGSQSISVIVPRGVNFLGGELGHNRLYFEEDYDYKGNIVPVYINIIYNDISLKRLKSVNSNKA